MKKYQIKQMSQSTGYTLLELLPWRVRTGTQMSLAKTKSGAGAEDVYLPNWKYYHILSFLRDPCTPEESSDNSFGYSLNITVPREQRIFSFHFHIHIHSYNSTSTPSPQGCVWVQKLDKAADAMHYAMGFPEMKDLLTTHWVFTLPRKLSKACQTARRRSWNGR